MHGLLRPGDHRDLEPVAPNVVAFLGTIRAYWKFIVGVAAATLSACILVLVSLTPRYEATAQLQLDIPDNILGGESVLGAPSLDPASIEGQIVALRSMPLIRRLVQQEGLTDDPEFGGPEQPSLTTRAWDEIARLVRSDATTDQEPPGRDATQIVAERFARVLEVRQIGQSFVLAVSLTSEDPRKAARLANEFVRLYLSGQQENRRNRLRSSTEALRKRLHAVAAELKEAEGKLQQFKAANGLTAERGTLAEQQISELNLDLIGARTALDEARARYTQAQEIIESGEDPLSIPDVASSPINSDLRNELNKLTRREAALSAGGESHPLLRGVQAESLELKRQIETEARRIVASLKNAMNIAQARESSLARAMKEATGQIGTEAKVHVQLKELERGTEASKGDYETALSRYRIASAEEALFRSESRLVSPATMPDEPSFPRKKLLAALALIFGIGFGVAGAVFRDTIARSSLPQPSLSEELDFFGIYDATHQAGHPASRSQPRQDVNDAIHSDSA